MKKDPMLKLIWLALAAVLACYLCGCQKNHDKYRLTPAYHTGQLVQFSKSIEHDYAAPGKRIWDIPQPMTIVSFTYNIEWRDNWYIVRLPDGSIYDTSIDELSLQEWNGRLEK